MTSRLLSLSLLAATCALAGCDTSSTADPTLFGPASPIGNGTARTYVSVDPEGTPTAVGVVLTAAALEGLPNHPAGHTMPDMVTLALPSGVRAKGLRVDHVSLDWNAHGHGPEGLFTLPHFDIHFYDVPEAERMTWVPGSAAFARGGVAPAARYVPQGYIQDPSGEVVPAMGSHWLDGADATYAPNGPGFREVVLFGSFDGRVVFAEPMMTRAFLQALPANGGVHTEPLAQPQAYATTGLYPTTYSVRYDAGRKEYRIELGTLVRRQGS